jgi:hypothetical protein
MDLNFLYDTHGIQILQSHEKVGLMFGSRKATLTCIEELLVGMVTFATTESELRRGNHRDT